MTKNEIEKVQKRLQNLIVSNTSILDIRHIINEYKNKGIEQKQIEGTLHEILKNDHLSKREEDRIRDVLDFVTGFCSAHLKIW